MRHPAQVHRQRSHLRQGSTVTSTGVASTASPGPLLDALSRQELLVTRLREQVTQRDATIAWLQGHVRDLEAQTCELPGSAVPAAPPAPPPHKEGPAAAPRTPTTPVLTRAEPEGPRPAAPPPAPGPSSEASRGPSPVKVLTPAPQTPARLGFLAPKGARDPLGTVPWPPAGPPAEPGFIAASSVLVPANAAGLDPDTAPVLPVTCLNARAQGAGDELSMRQVDESLARHEALIEQLKSSLVASGEAVEEDPPKHVEVY